MFYEISSILSSNLNGRQFFMLLKSQINCAREQNLAANSSQVLIASQQLKSIVLKAVNNLSYKQQQDNKG